MNSDTVVVNDKEKMLRATHEIEERKIVFSGVCFYCFRKGTIHNSNVYSWSTPKSSLRIATHKITNKLCSGKRGGLSYTENARKIFCNIRRGKILASLHFTWHRFFSSEEHSTELSIWFISVMIVLFWRWIWKKWKEEERKNNSSKRQTIYTAAAETTTMANENI